MCNNLLAESICPENGWRSNGRPIHNPQPEYVGLGSRRTWGECRRLGREAGVELALVQILVIVANIQMRTLKAEVEKGSA